MLAVDGGWMAGYTGSGTRRQLRPDQRPCDREIATPEQ
jgi:hypothetical protein